MKDADVDLNLLVALNILLDESSVTRAAQRLGLSPSAMSRTLTRLRVTTGDPLLVRAGRGLVLTPRATELRDRVHELTRDVQAVLRPHIMGADMSTLELTFTIRASEAFLEFLSGPVVAAVAQSAPRIRLRFAPKPDKDLRPLREGLVDLEIGVLGTSAPEVRTQLLFYDAFVGVARIGHPLLASTGITPERYAACMHVVTSREGSIIEPIDSVLDGLGLKRTVMVVVPGFPDAMRLVRQSNMVALVPRSCLGNCLASDQVAMTGLERFDLTLPMPEFKIWAMWHPRMDADPVHRWLRDTVMSVCRAAYPHTPEKSARL